MAMAVPADLFRFQLRRFLAARNRRMSICIASGLVLRPLDRLRRQWRGLRACRQRGSSRRHTESEFQKVPALHGFVLSGLS
jgi:hypothetical protein